MEDSDFTFAISPEAVNRDINAERRPTIREPSPRASVASGLNAAKPSVNWFEPPKPAEEPEKPNQPSVPPPAKTRTFSFLKGPCLYRKRPRGPPKSPSRTSSLPEHGRRYRRAPSISSLRYYVQKPMVDHYMPLGANADPEEVRAFLEEVKMETKSSKPKWRAIIFQFGWYLMLLSVLYFVFAGCPL